MFYSLHLERENEFARGKTGKWDDRKVLWTGRGGEGHWRKGEGDKNLDGRKMEKRKEKRGKDNDWLIGDRWSWLEMCKQRN